MMDPIEEILKQYKDIYNNNPDTFYITFYQNDIFKEIQGRPSKPELQKIIKISLKNCLGLHRTGASLGLLRIL